MARAVGSRSRPFLKRSRRPARCTSGPPRRQSPHRPEARLLVRAFGILSPRALGRPIGQTLFAATSQTGENLRVRPLAAARLERHKRTTAKRQGNRLDQHAREHAPLVLASLSLNVS